MRGLPAFAGLVLKPCSWFIEQIGWDDGRRWTISMEGKIANDGWHLFKSHISLPISLLTKRLRG